MARVINFNAGPSAIPLPVLEKAQAEFLDFNGTGMSIMEHSHRGAAYAAVHANVKALAKELLGIPDTHEVLFMQGGATAQFALLAMNYLTGGGSADYINTGTWSKKAIAEANTVGTANVVASSEDKNFTYVPDLSSYTPTDGAKFVHITSNNTIAGTQFHSFPDTGDVPLVADMSSDICSRPLDVSKFGVIYAGAQKNLGPSGVTMVIMRKDLASACNQDIPKIFRYSTILEGDSLQNTAPTFAIYMVGNVLQWIKDGGGLDAMEKRNDEKAGMLYGAIADNADYFRCPIAEGSRSKMNIVFRLPTEDLEKKFVTEATDAGIVGVKGHRSVGGIRISAYNAAELSSIETLVNFMKKFAASN